MTLRGQFFYCSFKEILGNSTFSKVEKVILALLEIDPFTNTFILFCI